MCIQMMPAGVTRPKFFRGSKERTDDTEMGKSESFSEEVALEMAFIWDRTNGQDSGRRRAHNEHAWQRESQ